MTPKYIVQVGIIAFLIAFSGKSLAHMGSEYREWYHHEKMILFTSSDGESESEVPS